MNPEPEPRALNAEAQPLNVVRRGGQRRARAERVFIENDKRSKAALAEMKEKHHSVRPHLLSTMTPPKPPLVLQT